MGQGYNADLAFFYKQDVEKAKALMIEKIGADLAEIGIRLTLKSPGWQVMFESLYSTEPEQHSPAMYLKGYGAQGSSDPMAPGGFPDLLIDHRTVVEASGFSAKYLPDVDFDFLAETVSKIELEEDAGLRGQLVEDLDRYLLEWGTNIALFQSQDSISYRDDLTGVYWNGFI